jgi:hypothetical protein
LAIGISVAIGKEQELEWWPPARRASGPESLRLGESDGVLEWWKRIRTGVLEKNKNWSDGVVEWWNGRKEKELENWSDGVS